MSDQSPLLVPMTVEALVVNDPVRAPKNAIETFMRTQMSYGLMNSGGNGQASINGNDANFTNFASSKYYNGVYLKWRLPKAFSTGVQDSVNGTSQYRPVPNRWLIVRYSGPLNARQATAWIVESDYAYPSGSPPSPKNYSQSATLYAQPTSPTNRMPVGVFIGRNVQLGNWSESGHSLGLTAMGPGNPAFAFYQPQCNNVFSFCDPLYGVPAQTLSYLVLGWFSSGADDPLHPGPAVASPNSESGYSSTLKFAPASGVEVQWQGGTLTGPGDTEFKIAAGTTGAMNLPTYIYLNPSVSATALQVSANEKDAQAPGCAVIAVAEPFFVAQLATLGWTLPGGTDPSVNASWSLLTGMLTGVQWQSEKLPLGGRPSGLDNPVSVAVGNTSIEALTALIAAQASADGKAIDTELLEAFQLNLLDALDKPDGAAVLTEKLRASFFQRRSSGYRWNIVDAPNATDAPSPEELAKEEAWLATLNQNQQALDAATLRLSALQRQLYMLWWKYQSWSNQYQGSSAIACLADVDGNPPAAFSEQLNPAIRGSLAWQVLQLQNETASLAKQVPGGGTSEAMEEAIANYAADRQLPASRQLKRGSSGTYYLPNNPVVLLAGAGSSGIVEAPATIQCRFPSQAVTGFKFNNQPITAATAGITIPQPQLGGVTGVPWQTALITNLVNEFYFVDADNAASVAAAIGQSATDVQSAMSDPSNDVGTYPVGGVEKWTANPWHPLLMFWQARYYPIQYGTPDAPNWIFEGTHYTWNQSQSAVQRTPLGPRGVIQLTPAASFNMQARLQQFLNSNPNLPSDELQAFNALLSFVTDEDQWDLLSQQLDGFNEQLQLGTPGVFAGPETSSLVTSPSLASLIGPEDNYPPVMPPIPAQGQSIPASQFQPWRAGQFEFMDLILVDEWGQALWPFNTNTYQRERVFLPPDLTPVLVSNAVPLTVTTDPAISQVTPATVAATGGVSLTITGGNFDNSAKVLFNGKELSTTFNSATELAAALPGGLQPGTGTIAVQDRSITSNSLPIQITGGLGISSISPNLYQAGTVPSSTLAVTVTGYGFSRGALVTWDGTPVDTTLMNATTLTAAVPADSLFAPGTVKVGVNSGGGSSNTLLFTVTAGAAIGTLNPGVITTGAAGASLTINGVGFARNSAVNWNGAALATTYVSNTQLTAAIPSKLLEGSASVSITESVGAKVLVDAPDPLIQLPPALLQPAALVFNLVSAASDKVDYGPANPGADPIAGWILPNHLDNSLMAYSAEGDLLGEMSVGVSVSGGPQVFWTAAPFNSYATLAQVAAAIPHFGPFLLALSNKTPAQVTDFLNAIEETLWTTVPAGASFDQSLAILVGRPLALVRARLQFRLEGGVPYSDPSWQNTFDASNCSQLPQLSSPVTGFKFGIEVGNVGRLDDGLIGYFSGDDYDTFNSVTGSEGPIDGYLAPIGVDNNYLYQPFDGVTQTFVSMLVDPRAPVHASTAILPDASVELPPNFTAAALDRMNVTFRVNGLLTDQQIPAPATAGDAAAPTILTATPKVKSGVWTWVEKTDSGWVEYPAAPNDRTARLTEVAPVLRRGLMRLSSALGASPTQRLVSPAVPKPSTKER